LHPADPPGGQVPDRSAPGYGVPRQVASEPVTVTRGRIASSIVRWPVVAVVRCPCRTLSVRPFFGLSISAQFYDNLKLANRGSCSVSHRWRNIVPTLINKLISAAANVKTYLGFAALIFVGVIALFLGLFSKGSFDPLITELHILDKDQFFWLVLTVLILGFSLVALFLCLGYRNGNSRGDTDERAIYATIHMKGDQTALINEAQVVLGLPEPKVQTTSTNGTALFLIPKPFMKSKVALNASKCGFKRSPPTTVTLVGGKRFYIALERDPAALGGDKNSRLFEDKGVYRTCSMLEGTISDGFMLAQEELFIFLKDGHTFFNSCAHLLQQRFVDKKCTTKVLILHPDFEHIDAVASMDPKKKGNDIQRKDCLGAIGVMHNIRRDIISNGGMDIASRVLFLGYRTIPTWSGFIAKTEAIIRLYPARPHRGDLLTLQIDAKTKDNMPAAWYQEYRTDFDEIVRMAKDESLDWDLWKFHSPVAARA
jgi:hypothetical protein